MTSIMIGFGRPRHQLGTVTEDYTLKSIDTGINGNGTITIYLPAVPSLYQQVTVKNTGTGTVTVSGNGNNIGSSPTFTVPTTTTTWIIWGGFSWGYATTCPLVIVPETKDFGVTTQGPAGTPYTVPDNTIVYEDIGYTPCGSLIRKLITTTYAGRAENVYHYLYQMYSTYPAFTCGGNATSTQVSAETSCLNSCFGFGTISGVTWPTDVPNGSTGWVATAYTHTHLGVPSYYTGQVISTWQSTSVEYYLDTHIIWSYEVISF